MRKNMKKEDKMKKTRDIEGICPREGTKKRLKKDARRKE